MRIGYLVPEFPSQTHAFFWRELSALREMGHEVLLLSTRRPPEDACRHAFAASARAETTYLFPPDPATSLRWIASRPTKGLDAARYVAGLSESSAKQKARIGALGACAAMLCRIASEHRLDHVHAHSCADAAHLLALARVLGGPTYSLTLHGDLSVYGTDHRSKMAGAAFVSTVTRPLHDQVRAEVGLHPDRIPVIWMGVDTDRFRPASSRPAPREGRLHVATIARLNRMKGHAHALRAMKRARNDGLDLTYTIAGEGPEREAIEAEIRRLDLGSVVHLPGSLGEDDVLALLQRADAFVLPSFGEGEAAPVSVMEAMSCALPVICTIIGGTKDMIDDETNGLLVPQRDEEALDTAFRRLGSDVLLRARLGENARRRACEAFDYRSNARRLAEAIARWAGDQGAGGGA